MSLASISYNFFGGISRSIKNNFLDVEEDLNRADINYTVEEYIAISLFITTVNFFVEVILFTFIFALFTDVFTAMLLGLTLGSVVSSLLFLLFYTYPSTIAKSRANRIRKLLPIASAYMATISSSKLPVIHIFRTLGKFKEYGEISNEARSIVNDVDLLGMSLSTALKRRARKTPSREFSELLWGINTINAAGGDMTVYLKEKTEELMNDYRRRIRKYAQDLSVYIEIYMTLIITGSIFFIVLSSTISMISGDIGTVVLQTFVVLVVLPLVSIAFMLIAKGISPLE